MIDEKPGRAVPQLDALTGIRGLAAWFVVLFHVRLSSQQLIGPEAVAAIGKGYLAVDLFFILSGFVLWLNYGARFRASGLREAGPFWWKRFARIWPLHAVILSGLVLFAAVLAATGRDHSAYPFGELPLHYLLVQNWGLTDSLTWNDPAWSISTEMGAYVLFPLLTLGLRLERLRLAASAALATLICAALYLYFALNGETSLGKGISELGLGRCIAEFVLGMVLCRSWQILAGRGWAAPAAFAGGAAIVIGGIAAGLPETAFVPAGFALGLLALALDRGPAARLLGSPPLRWLGDVSYSTYLVHVPLFVLWKLLFVDRSLQLGWGGLAGFLLLVLAFSALLHRWLELPAQSWLNAHRPGFAVRLAPAG